MKTTIDFSAQFGGRDAADALLPHFKALKQSSKGVLCSSPFRVISFILRVDGVVNRYGLLGAGNIDVNSNDNYVSVDIGFDLKIREGITPVEPSEVIKQFIFDAVKLLEFSDDGFVKKIDFPELRAAVDLICERYSGFLRGK